MKDSLHSLKMISLPVLRAIRNIASVFLVILLISVGCQKEQYSYSSPAYINDGLDVGTLDDVNIDAKLLEQAIGKIKRGKYGEVHSMLLFKDNKLVFEEYFEGHRYKWDGANHHGEWIGWELSTLHGVKSVSKSITSLCIGIAIDKGFIESVHQSVFDYLPDHQHLNKNGKDKITIEHLLTMTSGLEWLEWGASLSSESNDIVGIWFQDKDPLTFILEQPLIHDPGTTFNYSGGNAILLGEILKNATNMDLAQFSHEYLFKPLEIDSSDWGQRFNNGVIEAGGGLEITPRAMTKIGAMCINNGTFNGKKIISEQWIEKCNTQYVNNTNIDMPGHASGIHGYSYAWWLKTYDTPGEEINMYHAVGWGGQEIIVLPELNTVVVFTGGNYIPVVKVIEILDKFIL